jgi:hypothetical protein
LQQSTPQAAEEQLTALEMALRVVLAAGHQVTQLQAKLAEQETLVVIHQLKVMQEETQQTGALVAEVHQLLEQMELLVLLELVAQEQQIHIQVLQ